MMRLRDTSRASHDLSSKTAITAGIKDLSISALKVALIAGALPWSVEVAAALMTRPISSTRVFAQEIATRKLNTTSHER